MPSAGAVGDQIEDKKLALAASYSGVPLDTRVYRVTNNGVLENYKDSSDFWDSSYPTGNGFTTTGDYSSSALNPVAATGWDKSSRIYRVKNGAVVEYILDSSQGWHNGTY